MPQRKVLLVDDDLDLLRGLTIRLKACGYQVVYATDGMSAVSMAQRERPDLIVLDLGLPGGDGFAVMDRLKALNPVAPIPIIIHTARDPLVNRERALAGGAEVFLQKPCDSLVLLESIKDILGEDPETPAQGGSMQSRRADASKVLIVEDDQDLLRALTIRLRSSGYRVLQAGDALSAVSAARKEQPDVVVLDLGLPGGDGIVVMERLRNLPIPPAPVIVVTGRDPLVEKGRALEAGAARFLQKPVDNEELLRAIEEALRAGRESVESR